MGKKVDFLLRSMLYVPTYKTKFFAKVASFKADAIIFDLEDSVPIQFKDESRRNLKEFLKSYEIDENKKIFIRLNSIESKFLSEDLKYCLSPKVDGFILTKIYTYDDMVYYDKLITQLENDYNLPNHHFMFIPLIETASAVMDIFRIANSCSRVVAIAFGGEDYLNDMGGFHGDPPKGLDYPRAQIALAARSVGALPIDTPYLKIHDREGFCDEERLSFELGFAGCQCLHPSQIELANSCFLPTESEVEASRAIVDAIDNSSANGSGVAMLKGSMIGPPMEKRARKVLDLIERSRK